MKRMTPASKLAGVFLFAEAALVRLRTH